MDPVKYPPDMLAKGGPPFDTYGLRGLPGPLSDYAAVTLVWDGGWKIVAGEHNAVVAEGELRDMLAYLWDYGYWVEQEAGQ